MCKAIMDFRITASEGCLVNMDYWRCNCGYKYEHKDSDVLLIEDLDTISEYVARSANTFKYHGEFYHLIWEPKDSKINKDNYLCCPDCMALFQDNCEINMRMIKVGHLPSPIIIV